MSHLEPIKPRRVTAVTARVAKRSLAVVTTPLRKLPRAAPGKIKGEMFSLNNCVIVSALFLPEQPFQLVFSRKVGPGALSGAGRSPRGKQGGWGGGSRRQPDVLGRR